MKGVRINYTKVGGEFRRTCKHYFNQLFLADHEEAGDRWNHCFLMVPKKVNVDMNDKLMAPFSLDEIRQAIFQMHPTNGRLPGGFYRRFWNVVGTDVGNEIFKSAKFSPGEQSVK